MLLLSILRRLLFDVILVNRGKRRCEAAIIPRKSLFSCALPCANHTVFSLSKSQDGNASNQRRTRVNIASVVAIVGNATHTPPRPVRCASISAAASAASVFPSPMGASITMSPGCLVSRAIRTASSWTGRTFAPSGRVNRVAKRSWQDEGMPSGTHACGSCTHDHALSARMRRPDHDWISSSSPLSEKKKSSSSSAHGSVLTRETYLHRCYWQSSRP